uniref:Uncharacterized protein n=1 Tax=Sipha flava TaxID=143950 RepID=A0A2S2PW26_9HEMI
MWCFCRILNISWVDKVTNKEILRKGKEPEVMKIIKPRKLQYFGHLLRSEKYQVLQLIIQGKICRKRSRGRPRTSWLQNLREWFQYNTEELLSAAKDKEHIAMMISNLRKKRNT